MKEALIDKDRGKLDHKETKRPFVLAAVMLAMFMAAVEATIVSTAMPAIVAEIGGFSKYSWIFSSYLLMNSVTILIYGKLADLFGRKPIFAFGIIIFLIGSVLCGLADSMETLIIYRFIQGIGAGAVMPVATTIVGDIYTVEERAKIQGYLSSVWGFSAIIGPVLGGLFVEYISWKFVFWVNVPLGILSMAGIGLFLNERIDKKKSSIDYAGAMFMLIAISLLMIVLVEGGVRWSWTSWEVAALLAVACCFFILFIFQENRADDPMMPLSLWKNRSILLANVTSLTTGMMLMGISTFLPTFVQGVMGKSAMVAGFTLTTMSIGWPIASTVAGRIYLKAGFRATSILGGIFLLAGSLVFVMLSADDGPVHAMIGSFLLGVGMGLTSTSFIVSIQSAVDWKERGIATATNMFMRNLGNTVGAALLGGILNSKLQTYLEEHSAGKNLNIDSANNLLNPESDLSGPIKEVLESGLSIALHHVYFVVFLLAILSVLFIFFLPKRELK
ncbi:MDR family MFS transporter [Aeribacillus sp. FSL M8-0254]|uniref:MDR family MFS transporter n=1 Tax=Aeribacillus sp. FSL M8-0254 TaxID=2954577 RepID=UPI0030F673FA